MSHPNTPDNNNEPINLLRGWPASSLLPTTLIRSAAHAALSDPSVANAALAYGPDPGYEPARVAIAKWLAASYRTPSPAAPERLCITGGASQNLGCLLNVHTDPAYTRRIWIVAPSYFLAFRIFEDAGFGAEEGKMRAVPEDGEGLDMKFLESEVEKCERDEGVRGVVNTKPACYKPERTRAKVYRHVVYCVPSFANPSSRSMSLRRREELVRLARKWDMLCVADDVYDFLQWDANPTTAAAAAAAAAGQDCKVKPSVSQRRDFLPRLVDIDRDLDGGAERDGADGFGNACSNGSFSKIAGPGVRCGWVEGTKKFAYGVSQTGTTCSGGAPSQLTSTFMTHLLETGQLQNHIRHTLQPAYASNYHALHDAITTHLRPLGFILPQPTRKVVGGFFVWLSLPEGMAASDFARVCKEEEGVIVAPGAMFEVPGDEGVKFEGNVRLCFAWEEEERLVEGVKRMKRAAEKLLAGESGGGGVAEYVIVEKRDVGDVDEFK